MRQLATLATAVSPVSGAVVMGTGIVSTGLSLDGQEALSRALLVVAVLVWIVLGAALAALVVEQRPLLVDRARSPAALTGVAGTSVVGVRLTMLGWNHEAAALLVLGVALWLWLVPGVLAHLRRPTTGISFALTVATESLGVLGAGLAIVFGAPWLALAALACVGLGLVLYLVVLSLFDLRQLLVGRGDHWLCGGALAIATLACSDTARAAGILESLGPASGALDDAALGIWIAAALWLPPLVVAEVAAPRTGYSVFRWSTVFPLGMYAVCSFAVERVDDIPGIDDFARVWIWIAFAVWLAAFGGLLWHAFGVVRDAARGPARSSPRGGVEIDSPRLG
ncbi:MAG TPA: tellurite resistance/C4-dicarboxylate transporter family protein [Gaiellaceae bacterium]|nr:tellurite resistance/C4-dicarboxylate transporter family protein [Gaiellaceae bacterium]